MQPDGTRAHMMSLPVEGDVLLTATLGRGQKELPHTTLHIGAANKITRIKAHAAQVNTCHINLCAQKGQYTQMHPKGIGGKQGVAALTYEEAVGTQMQGKTEA